MHILVIHGPNLQLLGLREPEVYGHDTLADVNAQIKKHAETLGVDVTCEQHNGEGAICAALAGHRTSIDGLIINPGAYTHTSVAIRDAISGIAKPTVEVHLSNVHAREDFRRHSYITPVCLGVLSGFGVRSYILGMTALVHELRTAG